MSASTKAVNLRGVLDGKYARRLLVGGLVCAAALAGLAVPEAARSDGPLECNGRQPTVLAVPGVRTFGTPGADVIIGFVLARDTIAAGAGNDLACGLDRGDFLFGWTGSDHLRGNQGPDVLKGSSGGDRLIGGPAKDRMVGGAGFDRCVGGPGRDVAIECEVVKSAVVR